MDLSIQQILGIAIGVALLIAGSHIRRSSARKRAQHPRARPGPGSPD